MALEISEIGIRLAVQDPGREAGPTRPVGEAPDFASREALVGAEVRRVLGQLHERESR